MALREIVSSYWSCFQALLFPQLEEAVGALGQRHQHLVMVLEWVRVETLLPYPQRRRGCPHSDRQALARAFIAKAVFDLTTTRMLLDRLRHDSTLRQLCGWSNVQHIPMLNLPTAPCRAVCTKRSSNAPRVSVWWATSRAIRRRLRGERERS